MNSEHFDKLQSMYLRANLNQQIYNTTTCKIEWERSEIGLTISEKYFHALGAIHGSVYFKLLDDAAFFAVNSMVEDVFVLTTNFNIHLLRPVSKGVLKAIGEVKFKSRNLFIAESILFNQEGKQIALGRGNFMKSNIPLTEEIGYY